MDKKTQKRTQSLVYLNHKELFPDLIIKAFNSYVLSIYLYHAPILMLKEKKFKVMEKKMIKQLKQIILRKKNKCGENLLLALGQMSLEKSADI